ncbi:MAG: insulinase family protein, partial [Duncaniella sp.]|nr:insulinase family protein [Duncaniella sp.]
METEFHYSTLSTGLRVVVRHRPGAVVEHCGVAVNAGSRDEEPDRYGLAHFVEHTIFKGTARRRAWHIL